jgi:hypothetical protein
VLLIEPGLTLIGDWDFTAYDGTIEEDDLGRVLNPVVWHEAKRNLITTVGKQLSLDRLYGLGGAVALAGTGVGTSSTAAAVGDTALTGAVYKAFDALPTRTGLVVTSNTTYGTAEANITIAEAGLLTTSGGVLFNRLAPIGPFAKSTAVSLRIQVQVTQA